MALNSEIRDSDYVVSVWFERDRSNVSLSTPSGREVFALWDDDVAQAIEDGMLPTPRSPRCAESEWQPCAVAYARNVGLI